MELDNLGVGLNEFKRMNSADRDTLLYANIQEIKSKFKDYRLTKKIQYWWLSILTIIVFTIAGLRKYLPI